MIAITFSAIFSLIMVAVIVGTCTRIVNSSLINPSSAVFGMLFIIYFTTAILHPREFTCIIPGVLYFLALPSTFVLLQIYALFNLNNVSWGTREIKPATNASENNKPSASKSIFNRVVNTFKTQLENQIPAIQSDALKTNETPSVSTQNLSLKWLELEQLGNNVITILDRNEEKFFQDLINMYLKPLVHDEDHKKRITEDLKDLRNSSCFLFCMINALWMVLIFNLQFIQTRVKTIFFITINTIEEAEPLRYEPLSFVFVLLFIVIMLLQFFAMLWHRYKTLLHLIYTSKINLKTRFISKYPVKKNNHAKISVINNNKIIDHVIQTNDINKIESLEQQGENHRFEQFYN